MGKSNYIFTFFLIAILLTSTISMVMPPADAKKSQGTYNQKYGSATSKIVCGDKLCSEVDDFKSRGDAAQQSRFSVGGAITQQAAPAPDTGSTNDDDSDRYDVDVDCNEADASIYPGSTEIPNDGIDQDCNDTDLEINYVTIGTEFEMYVHDDGIRYEGTVDESLSNKHVEVSVTSPSDEMMHNNFRSTTGDGSFNGTISTDGQWSESGIYTITAMIDGHTTESTFEFEGNSGSGGGSSDGDK